MFIKISPNFARKHLTSPNIPESPKKMQIFLSPIWYEIKNCFWNDNDFDSCVGTSIFEAELTAEKKEWQSSETTKKVIKWCAMIKCDPNMEDKLSPMPHALCVCGFFLSLQCSSARDKHVYIFPFKDNDSILRKRKQSLLISRMIVSLTQLIASAVDNQLHHHIKSYELLQCQRVETASSLSSTRCLAWCCIGSFFFKFLALPFWGFRCSKFNWLSNWSLGLSINVFLSP